jgi:hypothetical protein
MLALPAGFGCRTVPRWAISLMAIHAPGCGLRYLVVDLDGARRSRRAAVPENIALATLAILTEHRGQIVTGRPP